MSDLDLLVALGGVLLSMKWIAAHLIERERLDECRTRSWSGVSPRFEVVEGGRALQN